ncbi:MAG: RimK family alpha-L-glutamate ligase [Planctomycetota bacterium]
MRIGVLGANGGWHLGDLVRAAGEAHEIVPLAYTRLRSTVEPPGARVSSGEHDLDDLDAVIVRAMPPGSLEQVVFRMDALAQLEAAGVAVVNPAKTIEAAVDKYLATARLQAAGLAVPRTACCQTTDDALIAFRDLGGDAVVKPVFGAEGRGITRVTDEAVAERVFRALEQVGSVLYLQEFIDHGGRDLRLLVIGDRVLGMQRANPGDWRTNASRGAVCTPLEVTAELAMLAQQAAAAVGATVAGVDLLPAADGALFAIEVNACPGWQRLARATGVDVAALLLRHVASLAQSE